MLGRGIILWWFVKHLPAFIVGMIPFVLLSELFPDVTKNLNDALLIAIVYLPGLILAPVQDKILKTLKER